MEQLKLVLKSLSSAHDNFSKHNLKTLRQCLLDCAKTIESSRTGFPSFKILEPWIMEWMKYYPDLSREMSAVKKASNVTKLIEMLESGSIKQTDITFDMRINFSDYQARYLREHLERFLNLEPVSKIGISLKDTWKYFFKVLDLFNDFDQIGNIFDQLCQHPLSLADQRKLINLLAYYKPLTLEFITVESAPRIIENNAVLMQHLILATQGHKDFDRLLNFMLLVPPEKEVLEIVNQVLDQCVLPTEFLHGIISNCIDSCRIITGDRIKKSHQIRMVCIFIRALIRDDKIDLREFEIELEPFLVENSWNIDAADLFREIKSLN